MTLSGDAPLVVPSIDGDALLVAAEKILPPTVPEFAKLALNVSSGDTMEKLFRRNNLNLGHLMSIAELDEALARLDKVAHNLKAKQ